MKIIFFGNTKYSVIVCKKLHDKFNLSAIVTIPDKPSGRKREITPNPVKNFASDEKIHLIETDKPNSKTAELINDLRPDFLVVADYGRILPKEILDIPKFASLNVHHSLLPKYRGPAPAPAAILSGDKLSGVTIIKMAEEVDAGDMLAHKPYMLREDETTDSLLTTLNTLGAGLLIKIINNFQEFKAKKQNAEKVSYTRRFTKEDGYFDVNDPPKGEKLDRMIRAFYPWPGVWTTIKVKSKKLKAKSFRVKFLPRGLIQPEGKKPMTVEEFLNGYPNLKSKIEKIMQ